jgi:Flp pilus assembly protein TadB
MAQSYDPDEVERIRSTRQVFAGNEVDPLNDPWARPSGPLGLTPLQRNYVVAMIVLLVIAAALLLTLGVGVATVPLFLLGVCLLAGWLLF